MKPVEPHCISSALCELYWSVARTRNVMSLTPYLCFSLDVPSVLFHVTDLKLSNRDSRASLQRARNVASCAILAVRSPCTLWTNAKPRARAFVSEGCASRIRRSIPNEREVYQRRSEHRRRFEADRTREEDIFSVISFGNIQVPQEVPRFLTRQSRRFGAPDNLFAAR